MDEITNVFFIWSREQAAELWGSTRCRLCYQHFTPHECRSVPPPPHREFTLRAFLIAPDRTLLLIKVTGSKVHELCNKPNLRYHYWTTELFGYATDKNELNISFVI